MDKFVLWTPFIGEILSLSAEDGNENDPYAVAVMKDSAVIGETTLSFLSL